MYEGELKGIEKNLRDGDYAAEARSTRARYTCYSKNLSSCGMNARIFGSARRINGHEVDALSADPAGPARLVNACAPGRCFASNARGNSCYSRTIAMPPHRSAAPVFVCGIGWRVAP